MFFRHFFQIISPHMLMEDSNELQITAMLQLDGTVDIQKAFDSVNHQF